MKVQCYESVNKVELDVNRNECLKIEYHPRHFRTRSPCRNTVSGRHRSYVTPTGGEYNGELLYVLYVVLKIYYLNCSRTSVSGPAHKFSVFGATVIYYIYIYIYSLHKY